MSSLIDITKIEAEVDEAFENNELVNLPFAQGIWTLLSVVEDHHFKITTYSPLGDNEASIYADVLLNTLTHPLRVCYQRAVKGSYQFQRSLIENHYILANSWLSAAKDYNHFCSIFPLYHAGKVNLRIHEKELIPTDWLATDMSYEVYDRFIAKRDPEKELAVDRSLIRNEVKLATRVVEGNYSLVFTRRLMEKLKSTLGVALAGRHSLPENWKFSSFSLHQYRKIFTCLQVMAYAWFTARQLAAAEGAPACAFASALWTPKKGSLVTKIVKNTGIEQFAVTEVLRYLTFGEAGIRNPDIAIQPIVDLTNGQYAISPFVILHVNSERNLCVLLNQIPLERKLYSRLVDQKEQEVRSETIASLSGLGLDFRNGKLADTDIDLAIIDRKSKICLCIEIKWFIEPAEIREVLARSDELAKGVAQAKKIALAFSRCDARLMYLLDVDPSYDFLSMVASVNFIGRQQIQDSEVPITKLWHLTSEIRKQGKLSEVLKWLRSRSYLPREGEDYKIREFGIRSGEWNSRWYGIEHTKPVNRI